MLLLQQCIMLLLQECISICAAVVFVVGSLVFPSLHRNNCVYFLNYDNFLYKHVVELYVRDKQKDTCIELLFFLFSFDEILHWVSLLWAGGIIFVPILNLFLANLDPVANCPFHLHAHFPSLPSSSVSCFLVCKSTCKAKFGTHIGTRLVISHKSMLEEFQGLIGKCLCVLHAIFFTYQFGGLLTCFLDETRYELSSFMGLYQRDVNS